MGRADGVDRLRTLSLFSGGTMREMLAGTSVVEGLRLDEGRAILGGESGVSRDSEGADCKRHLASSFTRGAERRGFDSFPANQFNASEALARLGGGK